jgi:hypothetical protein
MIGFRHLPGRNEWKRRKYQWDKSLSQLRFDPRTSRLQIKALPIQQTCLAVKVLVPIESIHTFRHLRKLLNCQRFRCTATGWFFQMLGVAAMADTRGQLKQEIGAPATLPHGPQLVSNDTAYGRIPTLSFQCNRLDPFHITGQMAIRRTMYAKLCYLQDMPTDTSWFVSRNGKEISLISKASSPALRLTQLPMQSVSTNVLGRIVLLNIPSSSDVVHAWSYTSILPTPSWQGLPLTRWATLTVVQVNFYNVKLQTARALQ